MKLHKTVNPIAQSKQVLIIISTLIFVSCGTSPNGINELFIPPLVEGGRGPVELTLSETEHEFFPGVSSPSKSFSLANSPQGYLGPTIKLRKGVATTISFNNAMNEATTVHGHGLHVSGDIDGGPHNVIPSGTTWTITIPTEQRASTSWYHPHLMGKTAKHVHEGLAGLYIIEDDISQALPLPKTYGVNDIPLIVQDRNFTNGKKVPYNPTPEQVMLGLQEETVIVNGTVAAYQTVPQGWVRLRILNAANARSLAFFFKGYRAFYLIATDGGFIETPLKLRRLNLMAAERAEIMIDLSKVQDNVRLMAGFLDLEVGGFIPFIEKQLVVELRTDAQLSSSGRLPEELTTILWENPEAVKTTREFTLGMNSIDNLGTIPSTEVNVQMTINGVSMNRDVINERVPLGQLELWRIQGQEMAHPFHIHGTSFQILSIDGVKPPKTMRGWKDTALIHAGWTEVLVRFNYPATEKFPYMYHCHTLEHEDAGMMGQFTVQ